MGKGDQVSREMFLHAIQKICDTSGLGSVACKYQARFFKNIHTIVLNASTKEWTAGAGHVLLPNLLAMPEDKHVRFCVSRFFSDNLETASYRCFREDMRQYQEVGGVSQQKFALVIEKCQAAINAFLMCKRACEELSKRPEPAACLLALESIQNQCCQIMGRALLDTWLLSYQQPNAVPAVIDISDDFFPDMSDNYIACVGDVSESGSASHALKQWLESELSGTTLASILMTLNRSLCDNDGQRFFSALGLRPYRSADEFSASQEVIAVKV